MKASFTLVRIHTDMHDGAHMFIQAVDRALNIYGALSGHSEFPGVRDKLTVHLSQLRRDGETDYHKLTVHGLDFLRQEDLRRDS